MLRLLLVTAPLALLAAACAPAPDAPPERGATPALAGTAWEAAAIDGRATADTVRSTVAFDAERASGYLGCNQFSGPYTAGDGAFSAGPLAATKMMCRPAQMDQEERFGKALEAADGYTLTPEGALLLTVGGREVLRLVPDGDA